jgi:effector-binding domain-containing protein
MTFAPRSSPSERRVVGRKESAMLSTPRIEHRGEQQYVAIRATTPMSGLGAVAPPLVGEVFGWLDVRGIEPCGPPFFRYLVVDMDHELELDVGVPVAQATPGDGRVHSESLPAGDYATAVFTGPYQQLEQATAELLGRRRRAESGGTPSPRQRARSGPRAWSITSRTPRQSLTPRSGRRCSHSRPGLSRASSSRSSPTVRAARLRSRGAARRRRAWPRSRR